MTNTFRLLAMALIAMMVGTSTTFSQETNNDPKIYPGGETHEVRTYPHEFTSQQPKNIILIIGDGMGVAHVHAGLTANKGRLFLENFKHVGFTKTHSANSYITDSAASATALATGNKTDNGAIGVDTDQQPVENLTETAIRHGYATGLVATSSITHATPAAFAAHQVNRGMEEEIAQDLLESGVNVLIGGGHDYFTRRKDGRNLVNEFTRNGYAYLQDVESIRAFDGNKLIALTAPRANGRLQTRGDMLPVSTETAIRTLQKHENGFFLMVEGSFIDSGGHANNTIQIVEEVLDLDRAIGKALDFAAEDGRTLIVVLADHETGGMTLLGGSYETGMVKGEYTTGGHSGVMTPVFAYGPGACLFTGIMDNTDIHAKISQLLVK